MKKILVTGGLGFIGSEAVICLIQNGYEPIIVDDLYNAKLAVLDRIETITGIRPKFYQIDVKDEAKTEPIFQENKIDSVIHFAGYKAVGESVSKPIEYYENNLETLHIVHLMIYFRIFQDFYSLIIYFQYHQKAKFKSTQQKTF